jgi:hypothetical protein
MAITMEYDLLARVFWSFIGTTLAIAAGRGAYVIYKNEISWYGHFADYFIIALCVAGTIAGIFVTLLALGIVVVPLPNTS